MDIAAIIQRQYGDSNWFYYSHCFTNHFNTNFGYGEDTTDKVQDADINNNVTDVNNDLLEEYILSPATGSIVPLKDVEDPIFSEGMMGKGSNSTD